MLMAARKLQGIGLVLLVLLIAMTLYPVSLQVAATRSALAGVERDILATQNSIRYLETEFSARASMRQLERWNADNFGYGAPTAGQFLDSERSLASLDVIDPAPRPIGRAPMLLAVAVATPTRATADVPSPAAAIIAASIPAAKASVSVARQETAKFGSNRLITVAGAKVPLVPVRPTAARTQPSVQSNAIAKAAPPQKRDRRAERLAMLDQQLLSPASLRAIETAATAENDAGGGQ